VNGLNRLRPVALAAVFAVCLGLAPAAAADAVPPVYVTPAAMAAQIHGLVPQIPTDNTSAPSDISATFCRGLGDPQTTVVKKTVKKTVRTKTGKKKVVKRVVKKVVKKYATFVCAATWERGQSAVWARPLAGGAFCASSSGLDACPADAPTAGDPRLCNNAPASPTADPNRCALAATETALIRAMKVWFKNPGWQPGNVSCKGTNLSRTCTYLQLGVYGTYYTATVAFAPVDGVWTATIAASGGQASTTCTVQPDPSTAAGAPALWSGGPTPTCGS
jgi:hypothetical protein